MEDLIKNMSKIEINKIVYQYNKKYITKYRNKNKEKLRLKRTDEVIFCDACNKNLRKDYFKTHLEQKRHLRLLKAYILE
jgi:hypothetical protein